MVNQEFHRGIKAQPRFFYGYIVAAIAFLILAVSWGIYGVFGVFFDPLRYQFGWSKAMISGALSLSMVVYGVLGIVVGGLNDRFGPRVVITFCGFLCGLGYLLMSQVNALWQLYLLLGVIIGVGMSGVWVPQLSTVARWFTRRRSLMTGIVIAGAGVGQLVAPLVVSRLIAAYDWRLSYLILGGVLLVVLVSLAQWLRRDPAQMRQLPYGENNEVKQKELKYDTEGFSLKESASAIQFWITLLLFLSYGYGFFAIMVHIVPHAVEMGIPDITAANILAAMGGISILGNYVLGGLADRIGNRAVFIVGCIMMSAALLWLLLAEEVWMLYLFAVVFGFAFGGLGAAESPLVAELFGLRCHGLIYGVVHIGFTIGAGIGPFVTGYIFDITGGYRVAFVVCAAFSIVGVILAALLRPTKSLGAPKSQSVS